MQRVTRKVSQSTHRVHITFTPSNQIKSITPCSIEEAEVQVSDISASLRNGTLYCTLTQSM
eukprot:GABW01004674.1.p3 GENE.GABW01004674.1~~GABW01004674.1.p3  ORF type:complete len:61 (+),score=7.11 GABW01004674.1:229-411(+)